MALTECPDCGREVSDQATACPNCGYPLAAPSSEAAEVETPTPEPAATSSASSPPGTAIAALVGAALVVIGSFLPWATVTAGMIGTVNVTGTEGDGVITAIVGAVLAIPAFLSLRQPDRGRGVIMLVIGGAILVVGFVDLSDVLDRVDLVSQEDLAVKAGVGIGLWMVLLGGGIAAIAGLTQALKGATR